MPDCENPGIAIFGPDWQKVFVPPTQSEEVPFTLLMENVNTSRVFLVKDDSYRKTMSNSVLANAKFNMGFWPAGLAQYGS